MSKLNKKGFTLIELMVAVVLLGLVITFLLGTLGGLRLNSETARLKSEEKVSQAKMISLLQDDVISSSKLSIVESDHYISLELQTLSSIYQINNPFVRWFVDPKKKTLIRSESAKAYEPPYDNDKLYEIHIDEVALQCEWFKAYTSKDSSALLIGLRSKNKNYFFEVALSQFKDTNEIVSNSNGQINSLTPQNTPQRPNHRRRKRGAFGFYK